MLGLYSRESTFKKYQYDFLIIKCTLYNLFSYRLSYIKIEITKSLTFFNLRKNNYQNTFKFRLKLNSYAFIIAIGL